MDLQAANAIAASGLKAQSARMRVISENIANADSAINAQGTGPYQRQMTAFQAVVDKTSGAVGVAVAKVAPDRANPFRQVYQPGHPLADAQGLVQYPNVDLAVEAADLREATRMYEANLSVIDTNRQMMQRLLSVLQ